MKIAAKRQVTVPQDIHEAGRTLIEHMRGRGTGRMSTDEIMALTRGES